MKYLYSDEFADEFHVVPVKIENYQDCYEKMIRRLGKVFSDFLRFSIEDLLEEKNWSTTFRDIPLNETTKSIFFMALARLERENTIEYDFSTAVNTGKHEFVSEKENQMFYGNKK